MSDQYANKDIYDKKGTLLLRKGQKITQSTIMKLKRHESYKPGELFYLEEKKEDVFSSVIQKFQVRTNIRNQVVLEKASKVLSTIIFETKEEPWWIYINTLANYIDWIYTHSINVSIISLMMAFELGYGDEDLFNIGLGALLHDIGKLLVPKTIIEKPSSLTDTEMTSMQKHCELGICSLEPFELPKECTDIVIQHHERLDGSGYPNGLKESEINHSARIAMIADVFDAITSDRPYREPKSIDTAIEILKNEDNKYCQKLIVILENMLG